MEINLRLDSLESAWEYPEDSSAFLAGWSTISITPKNQVPLAGYGTRDPKELAGIHDSSFVKTIILKTEKTKLAIISADLLIIHPELSKRVYQKLPEEWNKNEIYFTATHTHSGQGAWAPGVVGELFAGPFDEETITSLSSRIVESVVRAEQSADTAALSFGELDAGDLVYNRLVKEQGIIDPWLKILQIKKKNETGIVSFFSAHATCLNHENRLLTGDFPSYYTQLLQNQRSIDFAAYAAGAVGSMGPVIQSRDFAAAKNIAEKLAEQTNLLRMLKPGPISSSSLISFQLKLPMRSPRVKISKNLAIRPYWFEKLFGTYNHHLSIVKVGQNLFIGLPCDFSGELAVPLYQYARAKGLNLVLTSFNGDYIGYVIKDEWYDLPKYEARTMSWYGPDAGSYLSEIIKRIIDIVQ